MRHPICAQCVYWIADPHGSPPTSGHCHRFPPGLYVNPDSGIVVQKFPSTDHQQWCGEWSGDAEAIGEKARHGLARTVSG